ncbi:hypothetical protein OV090_38305 [Nannocystis sp. RBIL2]|uniref:hypothetical protein n=1 Tax=Nannocystis sp. RBIL2 TaxID=2996788 RepID=UPI00226F4BA7|nr:hypothetical protein [Nannocystis sp. RBIL2]MCY1070657.1 hypothetical protein [Nannocystis sp. RBIL2]
MFDLTGSFGIEGAEAVLRYKGLNTAQEAMYVAHLPSDARLKVYPNTAYCSLSPNGQQINLVLGDSPLPYDSDVEFGVRAFFVKVPRGMHMAGEIRMAVPLQEWSGYFLPHKLIKTELVSVRQLVLHVDVIPEGAVTWMRPARTAPDYLSVGGPAIRSSLVFRLDAPLPVAKRNDEFPRP